MSLDTALAIASLAVSMGALVPIFLVGGRVREVSLAIAITALVALGAVGAWRAIEHEREIQHASNKVMQLLALRPQTLNQLEQGLHHPTFSILLEAVDKLERSNQVQYKNIELYDTSHTAYTVGVYSVITIRQ
jgi:hypothetical protein